MSKDFASVLSLSLYYIPKDISFIKCDAYHQNSVSLGQPSQVSLFCLSHITLSSKYSTCKIHCNHHVNLHLYVHIFYRYIIIVHVYEYDIAGAGAPLTNFNDGRGRGRGSLTEVHILYLKRSRPSEFVYSKKLILILAYPKKSLWFLRNPKKSWCLS